MAVAKYGFEAQALRKTTVNFLEMFQRNCLQIVSGSRRTDPISNSMLYEKCGTILLSRVTISEGLKTTKARSAGKG